MLESGSEVITNKLFRNYKSRLLDTFYHSMLEVLNHKEIFQQNRRSDILSFAILYLILYFQFTSLMWRPSMPITSWDSYQGYWQILSYTRLDPLIYESNSQIVIYYLLSSFIYFTFLLFLLIFILSIKKRHPHKLIKWLVGRLLKFENSVLFIPILTFYSIHLSQSINYSKFYLIETPVAATKLTQTNSAICLFLHVFHAVACEYMSFEIRHSHKNKNFQAKAASTTDIKRIISRIIIIEMYCYFPVLNIAWLHILSVIVCIWLGSMYLIYVPYYNKPANQIVMIKITCELSMAVFFIIGKYFDSAGFVLVSSICIIPLMAFLAPQIVEWRYSKIPKSPENITNEYLFEVFMRDSLCLIEKPSINIIETFSLFSKTKNFCNLGLVGVWECNYCIYALNDIRLGFLKLYKVSTSYFSLEKSFQEFRCRKLLKENNINSLEDITFLEYILKLSKTKNFDKLICNVYINFAAEMVSASPSIIKLEKYVGILFGKLKLLKAAYEKLCVRYPKGKESKKLWISFNEDIYNYADNFIMNKIRSQNNQKFAGDLNYFDEKNGILLVSAEKESIGSIVYVNEQFVRIIGSNSSIMINSHINDIIPEIFTLGHNQIILNFANYCTSSVLEVPFTLFFVTERGYLVECFLSISCTSIGISRYYLVTVQKVETSRQCVMLDQNGVILGHSENFKHFTGTYAVNFKNLNLEALFPDLIFEELPENEPIDKEYDGKKFILLKSIKRIRKKKINVLMFFDDITGYYEMMSQSTKDKTEKAAIYQKIKSYSCSIKSKVRFDTNKIKDNKMNSTNFPFNTDEKHHEEEEKSKGDSVSKDEGVVVGLVKGLTEAIKNLNLMKWMMLFIVISN